MPNLNLRIVLKNSNWQFPFTKQEREKSLLISYELSKIGVKRKLFPTSENGNATQYISRPLHRWPRGFYDVRRLTISVAKKTPSGERVLPQSVKF